MDKFVSNAGVMPRRTKKRTTRHVRAAGRLSVPVPREPTELSRRIALYAAEAGLEKKAREVEILDLTGKVDYADFLVLMTGHSDRHVAAIADGVDRFLGRHGIQAISVEGLPRASWVLIDFVDVVVHVFQSETRALYDLDGLWMDVGRIPLPGPNAV